MKKIAMLFLLAMSLQAFGGKYRTLKEENVNISLSEIGNNNGKIEKAIKKGYSQETFLKYIKVDIEEIKYLSDNQAEVSLNIVIPSIEKFDEKRYEERLSEAFKSKIGYTIEEIKNRDLTKSEIEKLLPVYMKITGEEIGKINHFTSLNETVKVNKSSNSQWEMEALGLF